MQSRSMRHFAAKMIVSCLRRVLPERYRPIGYLTRVVRRRCDRRVRLGPFAGMQYIDRAIGSAYLPKLLGTYERELEGIIEQVCARHPSLIVDLGAAEGYYAVGLGLRNPQARVIAFERDEAGQAALAQMAHLNHVRGRLEIRANCEPPDLQAVLSSGRGELPQALDLLARRVPDHLHPFILCDVEGNERFLLDPCAVPGLRTATILVETHDFIHPGITDELRRRFALSHSVELIWQTTRSRADFPFRSPWIRLMPKSYLDWAVSEWRPARMCWLWMNPRDGVQ